jgi:hypothetical protein
MAWTYTPRTGTTASGGSPWTTGYSIALSDVFAIQDDLATWGGDVNAGGHSLTNLAGLSSSGAMTFTTAGVERARIASGGNVGIGSTSPAAMLHISQPTFSTYNLKVQTASAIYGICAGSAGELIVDDVTLGARRLTFLATTGYCGIGTTGPTSPLQVAGIPTYASDAAAGSGGLTAGAFYKDSGGGLHIKL